MAVFKVELDQESYEKLVTLAFDEERPPSWHIVWLIKKAIREAYAAAYPEGGPIPEGGWVPAAYAPDAPSQRPQ
jgi:hypothetical protein